MDKIKKIEDALKTAQKLADEAIAENPGLSCTHTVKGRINNALDGVDALKRELAAQPKPATKPAPTETAPAK